MSETSPLSTRQFLDYKPETLAQGYRGCRTAVNRFYRDQIWMTSNLPSAQRRDLDPLLFHAMKVFDLLNLQSDGGLPLDVWQEVRDDLNFAFLEQYVSPELAALIDVVKRYEIPKQFLFDPLAGADTWIRQYRFETYDELSSFAGRTAGSMMLSMMPVLGVVKSGYETAAIECGKGIMLTELLARCVTEARLNRLFLAREDLKDCDIDIQRLKLRKPMPTLKHLVRLYCWRIEKCFQEGGNILEYLDFDGRRSMTSLLGYTWKQMTKMQLQPDIVLSPEGILTRAELLKLKARHLLGLEGNLPFCSSHGHGDGH